MREDKEIIEAMEREMKFVNEQIQTHFNNEEGIFDLEPVRFKKSDGNEIFIKANKVGLLFMIADLLDAYLNFDVQQKTGASMMNLRVINMGKVYADGIALTKDIRGKQEPTVCNQTFKQKLGCFLFVCIGLFAIMLLIIGLVNFSNWIF